MQVMAQAGDEWSDTAVTALLDCYNEKYMELNGGSIGSKGWQDVILRLNSLCAQGKPIYNYRRCKNKLDVMKRRFKIERDRRAANGGVSDWPWFDKMEEIVGRNPKSASATDHQRQQQQQQQQQQQSQQRQHQPQQQPRQQQDQQDQPRQQVQQPSVFSLHGAAGLNNSSFRRDRNGVSGSLRHTLALGRQETISVSDDDDEDEDEEEDARIRNTHANKKRKKSVNGCCSSNQLQQVKEIAWIVTDALERMETKRLEVMRELELKRNEAQLQIARMIIDTMQQMSRPPSSSSEQQQK